MNKMILDFSSDLDNLKNVILVNIQQLGEKINNKEEKVAVDYFNKLIKKFEKECHDKGNLEDDEINIRIFFYRQLLELSQNINSLNVALGVTDLIIKNVNSVIKKNYDNFNPYYMCLIDTYMLTGLYCYGFQEYNLAKKFFIKAVDCGESNIEESKKTYHDALNCAHTWVGFYLYNEHDLEESLKHFERVLELYNEVKDEPNYHINEKDSVPNSISYINEINKVLNRR